MITSSPPLINRSVYSSDHSTEASDSDNESDKRLESETNAEPASTEAEEKHYMPLLPFLHTPANTAFSLAGLSNVDIDDFRQAIIYAVTGKVDPQSPSSEAAQNIHRLTALARKGEELSRNAETQMYEESGKHLFLPPLGGRTLPHPLAGFDASCNFPLSTAAMQKWIETGPSISSDIKQAKLEDSWRRMAYQNILLRMAVRYEHCVTIDSYISLTIAELIHKWGAPKNPTSEKKESPQVPSRQVRTPAEHQSSFTKMVSASADLYNRVISLIEAFYIQMARMLSSLKFPTNENKTHEQIEKKTTHQQTEEKIEKEYLYKNDYYLTSLSLEQHDVFLSLYKCTYDILKTGNPSSDITFIYFMKYAKTGQNIARTILSSEPNFGAVRTTFRNKEHCVILSNLTTVRAIAWYIEALAYYRISGLTGSIHEVTLRNAPEACAKEHGVFTIPDPDRKLYNFFAAAPTAYPNFLTQTREERLKNVLDTHISRMTIIDYSRTFPNGTNKMEFEPEIDDNGRNVLKLKFSLQNPDLAYQPTREAIVETLARLKTHLMISNTLEDSVNVADMSIAQLTERIDHLTLVRQEHIKQIEEDNRQIHLLENCKNPVFDRKDYVLR